MYQRRIEVDVKGFLSERYDNALLAERIEDGFYAAIERRDVSVMKWLGEVIENSGLLDQDRWEFEALCVKLSQSTRKNLSFGWRKQITPFVIRKWMREFGYEDVGTPDTLVFERLKS